MKEILITNGAAKIYEKYPQKIKNKILKTLEDLSKKSKLDLKSIPDTEMYSKRVDDHRLILILKDNAIIVTDIWTEKKFKSEINKLFL